MLWSSGKRSSGTIGSKSCPSAPSPCNQITQAVAVTGDREEQPQVTYNPDIDKAVRLGLGYPRGPLAMGDAVGPAVILRILETMLDFYGDPRYRPSPWLKRRAMMGLSLLTPEN